MNPIRLPCASIVAEDRLRRFLIRFFHRYFHFRPCLLFVLLMLLSGCAGQQPLLTPLDTTLNNKSTELAAAELLASDPNGPLPQPQIPSQLQGATPHQPLSGLDTYTEIDYSVKCESPGDPELAETFLNSNTLIRMQDQPLRSITGLEQRLAAALKEGTDILHSFGYYKGEVEGFLDIANQTQGPITSGQGTPPETLKVTVSIVFTPGPQYTIGQTAITHVNQKTSRAVSAQGGSTPAGNAKASNTEVSNAKPGNAEAGKTPATADTSGAASTSTAGPVLSLLHDFHPEDAPSLPRTLADVGVKQGDPAKADQVLAAVDSIRGIFRNSGYPKAQVSSSRYFLNHDTQTLDAEIAVNPGPFMRMGDIVLQGEASVGMPFLTAKQTWHKGEAWNQDKIEAYRDSLRQAGIFVSIDLEPGTEEDSSGNRPVLVALSPASERTLGGALKYDTSFGPGVQAFWEHRNLTGRGDSLRLELPVWMDMQELTAKYRLPYFLRDDQHFIAQLGILNQDLDAYNLQAARFSAGIERQLSRFWKLTAQGSVEGGSLKDPKKPREEYMMFGLPTTLTFDSTNDILNASRGGRAFLSLAPYSGEYRKDFHVLRSRLDLHRFIPLVGEDTLVLALRGTVGTLTGADADEVPPSVRFYSGGGSSVRGYEYQSLGPRNYRDDPLGGSALTELTIEPRWRFSDTFGVVAFVDGGMAHDDAADLGKDLRWGAGLGVRLYTPIGPVRFDVATPLTPRDDDEVVQFYISIGQSF